MAQTTGDQNKKGAMTVGEAGRKGGQAVVKKYGPRHMSDIGRTGGQHSHKNDNRSQ